jgi:hypothetical protein
MPVRYIIQLHWLSGLRLKIITLFGHFGAGISHCYTCSQHDDHEIFRLCVFMILNHHHRTTTSSSALHAILISYSCRWLVQIPDQYAAGRYRLGTYTGLWCGWLRTLDPLHVPVFVLRYVCMPLNDKRIKINGHAAMVCSGMLLMLLFCRK